MSTKYFTESTSATAEAKLVVHEMKPDRWMVTRIEIPEESRNQNWGTLLLDRACTWADEEGIVLLVHPEQQLGWSVDWFEIFFFKIQENGNLLREPRKK